MTNKATTQDLKISYGQSNIEAIGEMFPAHIKNAVPDKGLYKTDWNVQGDFKGDQVPSAKCYQGKAGFILIRSEISPRKVIVVGKTYRPRRREIQVNRKLGSFTNNDNSTSNHSRLLWINPRTGISVNKAAVSR